MDQDILREVTFVRDARSPAERGQIYAAIRRGDLVALSTGVSIERARWEAMDERARYLARIYAVAHLTSQPIVVSHASAAAVWGIPWIGPWPTHVHARRGSGRPRSTVNLRMHERPIDVTGIRAGIAVTSLPETILDLARMCPFEQAVVATDAALAGRSADSTPSFSPVARAELDSVCAEVPLRHGSAKFRAVLDFSDAASGSPGESLSRTAMARARIATPTLQQRFPAPGGRFWEVDFWWPAHNVIGEFDGLGKYIRTELTEGRTPGEVVMAEKRREDGLRALGPRVVRWGWAEARMPNTLAAVLTAAGVTRVRGATRRPVP